GELSAQLEQSFQEAMKLPLLWLWLANTAEDPQAQQVLLGILWRAAALAALALLAERIVQFALRRPLAALDAHAAREAASSEAGETPSADMAAALRLRRL